MNLIILSGNLTKDCELRYTAGTGKAVVSFSIAVNEGYGDKKTTQFFNITSFGAEKVADYLTKGTKVLIRGRLRNNSYEKDGVKHYTTEIIAENYGGIELLGKPLIDQAEKELKDRIGAGFSSKDYDDITPVTDEDIPF